MVPEPPRDRARTSPSQPRSGDTKQGATTTPFTQPWQCPQLGRSIGDRGKEGNK